MTYYGPWQTIPNFTATHDFLATDTDVPEPTSTYWTSTGTSENNAARGTSFTPTFSEHIQVGHVVDMSGVTASAYRWGRFALSWGPPWTSHLPPPPSDGFWDVDTDGVVLDASLTLTPHGTVTGAAGAIYYGGGQWRGSTAPFILGSFAFGATPTLPVSDTPEVAGSGVLGGATLGTSLIPFNLLFDVWDTLMTDGVPGGVITDTTFVELTATVTATIKPPRFRAAYDGRPPLAHRQRRDGAATPGPQLAHIGTAGSRPPLAWRQNTP